MENDIVTRLQLWENEFHWGWTLPNEAAAEIESLRKAVEEALRLGAIGAIVTEKWRTK